MLILRKTPENQHPDLPQDGRSQVDACQIPLGHGKTALVDADLFEELIRYHWRAVKSNHCWYAVRRQIKNGFTYTYRMHREIAKTPVGMECHHKNLNSLDNRRSNLQNLTPLNHYHIHLQFAFLQLPDTKIA